MTLVLTYSNPWFTAQVSDRRLTRDRAVFDEFANKTVIFQGRDGCVVVSYTGTAYVRGQTTDSWIAEQLCGDTLARGFGSGPPRMPDVGFALRRLAAAATALPVGWHEHSGAFVAGGFQWPTGRPHQPRAVYWTIEPVAAGKTEYVAQEWLRRRRRSLVLDGVPRSVSIRLDPEVLKNRLYALGGDVDAVLATMVDAIRDAAMLSPQIGADCMTVGITYKRLIRVQFFSASGHTTTLDPGIRLPRLEEVPAAFSPWIIGPGIRSPPLEMVGRAEVSSPAMAVELVAPDSRVGRIQARVQDRPPAPGWRNRWARGTQGDHN